MAKVVRAFSLDPSVSQDLDFYTKVPENKKPMNKSRYVNMALRFYMSQNLQEILEEKTQLQNRVDDYIVKIQDLHDEIRVLKERRGLLYRLKRLLRTQE